MGERKYTVRTEMWKNQAALQINVLCNAARIFQQSGGREFVPLVDCGALIWSTLYLKIKLLNMRCRYIPPQKWIHEPLNPHSTRVDRKVVSKVTIPYENLGSLWSAEFVVAPLNEHDALDAMPFLADEAILIDPTWSKLQGGDSGAPWDKYSSWGVGDHQR